MLGGDLVARIKREKPTKAGLDRTRYIYKVCWLNDTEKIVEGTVFAFNKNSLQELPWVVRTSKGRFLELDRE
jgi:hypothetical protein